SNNRLDSMTADRVLSIIRDRYADFGPTLACEKLPECHGRSCLPSGRIVAGSHRRPRARPSSPGAHLPTSSRWRWVRAQDCFPLPRDGS
ncbi:hypothetical protein PL79_020235, partial [Burkholderia sp. USMB20]